MLISKKMISYFLRHGFFLCIGLLLACGLKYHYSLASSNDLLWILGPTAWLVEMVSGIRFDYEAYTGFVSHGYRIIIAPACAGINFFIIAFCMALFSSIHSFKRFWTKLSWLIASLVSAYFITVGVNAFRIVISICLYKTDLYYGWLNAQRVHRLEGVVIYFFFLWLFYTIMVRGVHQFTRKSDAKRKSGIRNNYSRINHSHWLWAGLIPLFWYSLVTVGVPLFNGALRTNAARFAEHSGMVLFTSLAVLVVVFIIRIVGQRLLLTFNRVVTDGNDEPKNSGCRR